VTNLTGQALRIPRIQIAVLVVIGLAQAATLVALVLILRRIIELLGAPANQTSTILGWVAVLAGILVVNAVLRGVEFAVGERMGYQRVRALRLTMYRHLARMTPRHLQHRSRGALVLRFTGDLTMLRTWISRGIARGIVSSIVLVAGAAVLFILNPLIASAMLGTMLLGSAASLLVGTRLRGTTRSVRRKRSMLTSNIDEQINALGSVQAFGRATGETERLSRQNDLLTRTLIREADIRAVLRGLASASAWLSIVAGIAVGAIEVERGRASLGVVVAAITASRFLIGPVRDLGLSHEYWQRARVSRDKIEEFMRSRSGPETTDFPPLRVPDGRIELVDVPLRAGATGITATVLPRQVVAVVGPTGSGKSALIHAVMGMPVFPGGTIRIDDQDIATVDPTSLRRHVGAVSADLALMRGTVRRNLTYRRPAVSTEELARTVLQWHLDEWVVDEPLGLDAWITEGGRNLSAGQRQRLALARAFLDNPTILALDEPGLHLDTAGRDALRIALGHHAGAVLVASHDPFEIALADRVWVLDRGVIVEDLDGAAYRAQLGWMAELATPA